MKKKKKIVLFYVNIENIVLGLSQGFIMSFVDLIIRYVQLIFNF